MTEAVNANMVRAFFTRWERLEEEKEAVSVALKELFGEAKDAGFNAKALRSAFRIKRKSEDAETKEKIEAEQADLDLYLAALGVGTDLAIYARDARKEFTPHRPTSNGLADESDENESIDPAGDESIHTGGEIGAASAPIPRSESREDVTAARASAAEADVEPLHCAETAAFEYPEMPDFLKRKHA